MEQHHYTISCRECGAIRSYDRQQDDAQLADTDVLAQAPHSGGCALARAGNGAVSIDSSNPTHTMYSIS